MKRTGILILMMLAVFAPHAGDVRFWRLTTLSMS